MDIHTRHYHDVAILSVNGRLDSLTSPQLAAALNEQLSAGYNRLVADLNGVDFISSAGIKVLLKVGASQARQAGGDLRLAGARAHVKYVLHLAQVNSVIRLYPTVVAATASYFPGPLVADSPPQRF